MIPDETYLDRLAVSIRLLDRLKCIIAYNLEFEGRRQMTFGNAKRIPIEELSRRSNVGPAIVEEWGMFIKASSSEEAARNWSKETLRRQIAKYEKALVNYKRGIETQERRLAELRAQLETIDD
jgi:hypothetical protein